mgnify:CR=1 FL=1
MAKLLVGTVFRQGIGQGVWWLVKTYWPSLFPMLTIAGQYFSATPWPYFFTALSVAVCMGIWGVIGISRWRSDRRLESKIVIGLVSLFQAPHEDGQNCRYHLNFEVYNGDANALYMQIGEMKWSLDDGAMQSVDISPSQGMIAPRRAVVLASPVILRPNTATNSIVGGEFSIEVEVGREFGMLTKAVKQVGTFTVLATASKPIEIALPASAKITDISFKDVEAS